MSTIVTRMLQLAFFLSVASMTSASLAAEIETSCMAASFSIQDRSLVTGAATVSCGTLESRRMSLFSGVTALPKAGSLDISSTMKALADIEEVLKKHETDKAWANLASSISGNTLATLSFAACIENSGAGCSAPIVGKALSLITTVNGAMSDAHKAAEVSSFRAAVASTRVKILDATPPVAIVRDRLVLDSNNICAEIRRSCL